MGRNSSVLFSFMLCISDWNFRCTFWLFTKLDVVAAVVFVPQAGADLRDGDYAALLSRPDGDGAQLYAAGAGLEQGDVQLSLRGQW